MNILSIQMIKNETKRRLLLVSQYPNTNAWMNPSKAKLSSLSFIAITATAAITSSPLLPTPLAVTRRRENHNQYSQDNKQCQNDSLADDDCKIINNKNNDKNEKQQRQRQVSYIDQWHASTIKPTTFYEEHAKVGKRQKNYFYSIDLQGRVFLEETLPKNIATSIKSPQFLDFFHKRIKRVSSKEIRILKENTPTASLPSDCQKVELDYPFVSPCGLHELNFIRPADLVIVFHSLQEERISNEKEDGIKGVGKMELVFGATLAQPFSPRKLALSKRSGRLYHELITSTEDDEDNDENAKPQVKKKPFLTPLHSKKK